MLTNKYRDNAKDQPKEPLHLFNLGSALQERGKLKEAIQCYKEVSD